MNPESDSLFHANEDGSGSGINPISSEEQLTDDEDSEQDWREQGSGSGEAPVTITDAPGNVFCHSVSCWVNFVFVDL